MPTFFESPAANRAWLEKNHHIYSYERQTVAFNPQQEKQFRAKVITLKPK